MYIDVVPAIVDDQDAEAAWIPRLREGIFVATSVERQMTLIQRLDTPFKFLRHG